MESSMWWNRVDQIWMDVRAELLRATIKHPTPFRSPHEGFAIFMEEVDELWSEVKSQERNSAAIRREAVQSAAMAIRFLVDVCDKG